MTNCHPKVPISKEPGCYAGKSYASSVLKMSVGAINARTEFKSLSARMASLPLSWFPTISSAEWSASSSLARRLWRRWRVRSAWTRNSYAGSAESDAYAIHSTWQATAWCAVRATLAEREVEDDGFRSRNRFS